MTVKTPLAWTTNPAKSTGVAYSSSSVTYSSATTYYSSADAAVDVSGKSPSIWTKESKTALLWVANPSADDNQYAYDSSAAYDSTRTYDGITTGEDTLNESLPTAWSEA